MAAWQLSRRGFFIGGITLAHAAALTPGTLSAKTPVEVFGPESDVSHPGAAMMTPSLSQTAGASGRYFGAATRIDYVHQEAGLKELMLQNCSHVTPEIHLKWDSLEWNKGQYNFSPVDDLVAFSNENGLRVRGHTLLWDQSTPAWAKNELLAEKNWGLISRHFTTVLDRYSAHIEEWDVINEPIDTQAGMSGLRRNTFFEAFGSSYVERALQEARAHSPTARLVINDYGFDYENSVEDDRRRAFLALLTRLRNANVPIDGVGIQAHLDLSKGPIRAATIRDFLARIADLGLDITITELDVKELDIAAAVAVRDREVADEVKRYLDVALAQPAVKGVVTWGLTDKHSWLSDAERAVQAGVLNRGLPYDDALSAKPMYWNIKAALDFAAQSGQAFEPPAGLNHRDV